MGRLNKQLNAISSREIANDKYYTPPSFAKICIDKIPIEKDDILFDPFFGNGAFYNNFPNDNKKFYTEIEMGLDFFNFTEKVDWIISNPPFSILNPVLDHTLKICRKGFAYILMTTAFTIPRLEKIAKNGFHPQSIIYFVNKKWGFGFLLIYVIFGREKKDTINFDFMRAI